MAFKAYETSSAQKRLYMINHLLGDSILYNEIRVLHIKGGLDPDRFKRAVMQLAGRHEILRTCFVVTEGELLQKVYDRITVDFTYTRSPGTSISIEMVRQPGTDEIEDIIDGFLKPYDLGKVPLWKIELVRLGEGQQLLLFDFHHIICDGTSMEVVIRELIALYLGQELPIPDVQYVDFTTWQNDLFRDEDVQRQEVYWLKIFSGKIPVLDLPTDFPRPLEGDIKGDNIEFAASDQLTAGLRRLAAQFKTTLYVVLLSGLNVLLSRYSKQEDIVIGGPVYGRSQREFENMVGMFVNTLAMRNKPEAHKTFADFLSEVSANALAAFDNQDYQFEMLVEKVVPQRQLNRNPLFDVMFALQNYARPIDISQLGDEIAILTPFQFRSRVAKFDLTFQAFEVGRHIDFRLEYKTSLFRRDSMERLTGHLLNIFCQVTENCQKKISHIRMITETEQKHVLEVLNDTAVHYPEDKPLHEWFRQQAARTPDRIALVGNVSLSDPTRTSGDTPGGSHLSYDELNRKSNRLAHLLRSRGVKPGIIVGIMVEPSFDLVIGILGILKAGGAYLPIDTAYPVERVLVILKDSSASFLLTYTGIFEHHSYTALQNLQASGIDPHITGLRDQGDFDSFPHPDRSLIDYKKYSQYIGHAMVKKAISIQGTRGCPYNCAYCHRTMLKKNVARSAENIFEEVQFYYARGVRRFSFVDEIFNLNEENSRRFFNLVLKNRLKVQLFFPNGMRADRMTRDYVDLMVEAGTVNLGLALETASPRLQKLIKKNLDIDKLRDIAGYFCSQYPGVILELFTMHGFPTESEEEALETLNLIKSLKWVHFPYVFLLKIHPSTDMMKLALDSGISRETIERSMTAAFHEIPETLPFPKSFTRQYVARFMKEYFLNKERLLHVLPHQLNVASEDELARKYDNYLPAKIRSFPDILENAGISPSELGELEFVRSDSDFIPDYAAISKKRYSYSRPYPFSSSSGAGQDSPDTFKILLLDLSVLFTTEKKDILHGEITEPLGLMYLLTYLNRTFGSKINGRMYKSQIDFDSYEELQALVCDFQPHLIGIRTLSYFKDFFHRTVSRIKAWGIQAVIIAGGPYGTSDYKLVLQDPAVDLTVLREGEITLTELVEKMMANGNKLPSQEVLRQIPGIAFIKEDDKKLLKARNREIICLDKLELQTAHFPSGNPGNLNRPDHLLYLISTSGSTGKPKGVMLEHRNIANLLHYEFSRTGVEFDRVLQFASIGFDISVQEIFSTLLWGGTLFLIDRDTRHNIPGLFSFIHANRISVLFLPPAFLKLVFEDREYAELFPRNVRHIIAAGEQLVVPGRFSRYLTANGVFLHNHYGPAETHVVTALTMPPPDMKPQFPSIGTPVYNTRILILNENLHLEPLGLVGEITITGANVGRGYCNQPLGTRERYVSNPFTKGERMYRTGDLGRWLANGEIEFLGRKDQQVKIRGFRIELEEVEEHVKNIDFIKDAVVLDNETANQEKYLTAYIVLTAAGKVDNPEELSEIRDLLARSLPDYMIPSYFKIIDRVPLNPSGKIDKKALRSMDSGGDWRLYRGPENRLQRELLEIWSDVLKKEKTSISIDENFFETGGHSLSGAILIARIQKKYGVRVPLGELFKRPTVRGLEEYILDAGKSLYEYDVIRPVEKKEYYPQSSTQKRLFFLDQLENIGISYNMPAFYKIGKSPHTDTLRLQEAMAAMIRCHQSLRTSFHLVQGIPVQRVHDEVQFEIEYHEPGDQDYKGTRLEEQVKGLIADFLRPFVLGQAPLFRMGIITLPGDEYLLLFDMHHIITDGTSIGLFLADLMTLLAGSQLEPLNIQYTDYSQWQSGQRVQKMMKNQETYWLKTFTGEVPVLNLPLDYTRPAVQCFRGNRIEFRLDSSTTGKLKSLARHQDATLYMVLLAVFYVLLYKLSGQEDITLGTPMAARRHADLQKIIGMFVNTLALRNFPRADQGFADFLKQLRNRTLSAFDNQEYPFEDLVNRLAVSIPRDMSRNPVFDVMFALHNQYDPRFTITNPLPFDNVEPYDYEIPIANFDLELHGNQVGDSLYFILVYSSSLFKKQTVERFATYFISIAGSAVDNPGQMLCEINILDIEEKNRLLFEFNQNTTSSPPDKTIHAIFEELQQRIPDRTALVEHISSQQNALGQGHLSYRHLNQGADRLALTLKQKGVRPDTIVAIMVERSLEMVIGLLAILKAGGVYLPIDPALPAERTQYMLADSSAKILLTLSVKSTSDSSLAADSSWVFTSPVISGIIAASGDSSVHRQPSTVSAGCGAYVIYTSGSTGRPRGVLVEHKSLLRLVINQNFIDISDHDRLLLTGAVGFDIAAFEIWFPLLNAFGLYLAEGNTILDAEKLKSFIVRNRISLLHLVPQLFDRLAGADVGIFAGLRYLLVGGDLVRPHYVNIVRQKNKNLNVLHMYGPTENTIFSTFFPVDRDCDITIPIGKPIGHSRVYILDTYKRLQPVGVVGELYTGGRGVARGYLNNPELTLEKFINYKLQNTNYKQTTKHQSQITNKGACKTFPDKKLLRGYKTGDLGRWLADGNIEFAGRIDNQVKIRGIRIELGEIESQLLTHQHIEEAAVILRDIPGSEQGLCAYVVCSGDIDDTELREYLSKKVPNVMIPNYFIKVAGIPVTPNGKVDAKALPMPEVKVSTEYTAPRDELERQLAYIWQEVLGFAGEETAGRKLIGIDDDFFRLGGHSLKATGLAINVHKEFNVKLPLEVIFNTPHIRGLSEYIKQAKEHKFSGIEPVEKKEYYPLSPAQQRMMVLQQMAADSTVYNMPFVIPLDREPDIETLEQVFEKLLDRHESLKTFFFTAKETPVQGILEKHYRIKITKLQQYRHLLEQETGDKQADTLPAADIIKNFIKPFDLSRAPLLRAGVIVCEHDHYLLMLDMHHIIVDGMSMQVLARDFSALYQGNVLSPLRLQYKDYSCWQREKKQTGKMKQQEKYWLERFCGESGEIPVLVLPIDFPRPGLRDFTGSQVRFQLPNETVNRLKTMAAANGATLYMVLLALFNLFLSKLTGQDDILVGTPTAGRRHAHLEQVMGMFVNTLVLRNDLNSGKSFLYFLTELKKNTLQAFENQEYPFEDLVDKVVLARDTSRNPLFDVMFVMQNIAAAAISIERSAEISEEMPGIKGKNRHWYENLNRVSKFDLTLTAVEEDQDLFFEIEYCTRLFKKETMERFITYFKNIVSAVLEKPRQKLAEIELITGEEKRRLIYNFNDTAWEFPAGKSLHELFEEQVEQTPDHIVLIGKKLQITNYKPAVESGEGLDRSDYVQVSYGELNNRADQLACFLKEKGVASGTIVAIMVERSLDMIIGIMAIIKSGGAYLPIEPGYPEERIQYMLADSSARMLLTLSSSSTWLFSTPETCKDLHGCDSTSLSVNWHPVGSTAASLLYIIYTSGTSGRPKGVMVNHHSAVNTLLSRKEEYNMCPGDVSLQLFSYAFDGFVTSFFTPVISGAAVVILRDDEITDMLKIREAIVNNRVTHFISIPALFQGILDVLTGEEAAGLRVVTLAGDLVHPGLLETVREKCPGLEIVNEYGITECSVMSTIYRHQEKTRTISIGKPIPNTQAYILDRNQNLQPIGVYGELYISGAGIARGYLNKPELTLEKFIKYPLKVASENKKGTGQKFYRTGDVARWWEDGNIEFLGRIDSQVKIRGFRIEVKEIEIQLMKHHFIKEAIVKAGQEKNGEYYLCAYLVSRGDLCGADIKHFLAGVLPDYMIPSFYIFLEALPLTPNGKVDRKALPAPVPGAGTNYVAPRNKIEEKLAAIWSELLNIPAVGIDDNFFRSGGHSIKAALMTARIHQQLNVKVPLAELFKTPFIRGLAQYIAHYIPETGAELFERVAAVEKRDYYLLSRAQPGIFAQQQNDPALTAYNMPQIIPLPFVVDRNRLEATFEKLIRRHESFRTSFHMLEDKPVFRVHAPEQVEFGIEYYDLKRIRIEDVNEETGDLTADLIRSFIRPFDLSLPPLLRAGLIKTGHHNYILILDLHHIITDGVSSAIFSNEIILLYNNKKPAPLRIQYKDYAVWQNSGKTKQHIQQQKTFWLDTFQENVPPLNLPLDFVRPAIKHFDGSSTCIIIEKQLTLQLYRLAEQNQTTLYMTLLAIYFVLLAKYSNREDMVVGSPVTGRRHADLQDIIGMFVNMLAIREKPQGTKTFKAFLSEVKSTVIDCLENQDYYFQELVAELGLRGDAGRNPLFDVVFVLDSREVDGDDVNESNDTDNQGKEPGDYRGGHEYDSVIINARFDLLVSAVEIKVSSKIAVSFEYATALFKHSTIKTMAEHFTEILNQVVENENIRLADILISHDLAAADSGIVEEDQEGFAF